MTSMRHWLSVALAPLFLIVIAAFATTADEPAPLPVADDELLAELKSAPSDNVERVQKLRDLYLQAGAKEEEIALQEVPTRDEKAPKLHNVIVTLKGETDNVIVVGGHLDKVTVGQGVIDDWSGACLATNLYQTLLTQHPKHTFVFMGFAHEERGLLGSKHYVSELKPEQKAKIRAMVNLECLGVADPFIWTNGSSDRLETIAHRAADEYKLPLNDHVILGVGSDSIPFERAGIPNITFDGLPLDQLRLIHSPKDTYESIKPECYVNAYRVAARFLLALDRDTSNLKDEPKKENEPKKDSEPKPEDTPK